jgi:hypothetical protein
LLKVHILLGLIYRQTAHWHDMRVGSWVERVERDELPRVELRRKTKTTNRRDRRGKDRGSVNVG